MDSSTTRRCGLAFVVILLLLSIVFPSAVRGGSKLIIEKAEPQKLFLTVGKSVVFSTSEPIKRVSLGSQDVADAIVLSPKQISVIGKTTGVTNLILWGPDDKISSVLDIQVSPDVARLGEMIRKILPDEKDLRIDIAHDSLTLSGTVSSTSRLSQALALAEVYSPKDGKIVNLVEVAGVHQVMLEVRVAEMSRTDLKRLGFNWDFSYFASKGLKVAVAQLFSTTAAGALSSTASISKPPPFGHFSYAQVVDALNENGLIKILAKPNLITLSGKTASFLAGGEYPVPVPQSTGGGSVVVTIEYKPFGVGLHFTPTVLGDKKISMEVAPEVSQLDFSNGITLQGYKVPTFNTRRVSTVIELADGQSFAIAGLLMDEIRETIDKFPLLGEIPILGALFRSSSFQKNETELIVIVTPHLVQPLDVAKQTLPTDQFIEPDDFEFYLLGHTEGTEKSGSKPKSSQDPDPRPEGGVGHIVPK